MQAYQPQRSPEPQPKVQAAASTAKKEAAKSVHSNALDFGEPRNETPSAVAALERQLSEYLCCEWPQALPSDRLRAIRAFRNASPPLAETQEEHLKEVERQLLEAASSIGPPTIAQLEGALRPRAFHPFGNPYRNLAGVTVSVMESAATPAAIRKKLEAASQLLSQRWAESPAAEKKGILSVHLDHERNRTIVHVGSGRIGSVVIEIPRIVAPQAAAEAAIAAMKSVLRMIFDDANPVAVIDGDFGSMNFKKLLPDRIVVRSRTEKAMDLRENLRAAVWRPTLTPARTTIISGIPASESELRAVLKKDNPPWDVWTGTAMRWERTVAKRGFRTSLVPSNAVASGRDVVLEALRNKDEVIVLVAHAESGKILFPKPPPDGSYLSSADIEGIADDIRRNRPMVYLFCCESAKISDLEAISQTLLRCGVAAVVAPQGKISTVGKTAQLFDTFLSPEAGESPLATLSRAEKRTGFREMEAWIG